MENGVKILTAEALEVINRSEIDVQVSTAKKYPRELQRVMANIETLATLDTETAEDCFYALKRGSGDDSKLIEGLSVRFAEIIASSWGNLRIQSFIVGNDGKKITVRGVCHDLENNLAVSTEVNRRIIDKYGKTYSEDMQIVTANAASSIAFRNAVLKVVPKAITKAIVDRVKKVAMGKSMDLETSRQRIFETFKKMGVEQKEIFEHLEIKSVMDIDTEKVLYLRGLYNAIKEGSTSVHDTFHSKKTDSNTSGADVLFSDKKEEGTVISEHIIFEKEEQKPCGVSLPQIGQQKQTPLMQEMFETETDKPNKKKK